MDKSNFKKNAKSVGGFLAKGIPIHGAIKYHKNTKDNGWKYGFKMAGYVTWAIWSLGKLPVTYNYLIKPVVFPQENRLEKVIDSFTTIYVEKDSTINLTEYLKKKNEEYFNLYQNENKN